MQPSAFAVWLDTFFASFDGAILEFFHLLAEKAGFILTPISYALDFMGDDAIFFFVLAYAIIMSVGALIKGAFKAKKIEETPYKRQF